MQADSIRAVKSAHSNRAAAANAKQGMLLPPFGSSLGRSRPSSLQWLAEGSQDSASFMSFLASHRLHFPDI